MITCQHARHLFDAYLDGELSAPLRAELHAHRIACSRCQNELALLEACGDVVATDRCEPALGAAFTDRVMLAYRAKKATQAVRWSRVAAVTGPAAAAAAVALFVVLPWWQGPATLNHEGRTAIAGRSERVPSEVIDAVLSNPGSKPVSPEERAELERTPEMASVGVMESMFVPLVDRTIHTWDGTRRTVLDVVAWGRAGISQTDAMLLAEMADLDAADESSAPDEPMFPILEMLRSPADEFGSPAPEAPEAVEVVKEEAELI